MKLSEDDPIFIKMDDLAKNGFYGEILELIHQVPHDKWTMDILCAAGNALNRLSRFDEVECLLNKEKGLCISNEDKARWCYLLGYAYYGRKQVEKAKEFALQAFAWNPDLKDCQDLLLLIKQLCYEELSGKTYEDKNFSWEFTLSPAFYDFYLIIKGSEDCILEKIQIFSELYPEGARSYEFSYKMLTNRKEFGPFMILAYPDKMKIGDMLNFALWFEENAFLLAFHKQEDTFSFATTLCEYNGDVLLIHFENNLAAFVLIPTVVGKNELKVNFDEDRTFDTLETVCQSCQVTREDLESVRRDGKRKDIHFIIW